MKTEMPVHNDLLGNELSVGATVATTSSHYNDLLIAEVVKFTPKMVSLKKIGKKGSIKFNRYPTQMIVVSKDLVTMAVLKNLL